jgi:hypothetical protein
LVLVDIPETDDPEIIDPEPKKKKGSGGSSSPSKKKKNVNAEIKKEQLSVLIKTVFDVIGTRQGFEVWSLSQQESVLIADPLSNILNKNPLIDKLTSDYGDYIALIVAIGTIIIPRLMIQMKNKPKKEEKISYVKQVGDQGNTRDKVGENGTSPKQNDRVAPDPRQIIGNELHLLIPSIQ